LARERNVKKGSWNKKKWYPVKVPKMFGDKIVAETPALKEKHLIGRIIEIPLNELTGSFKHFKTKVFLRVTEIKDGAVQTEYYGQEQASDVISRLVRKWSSRIDLVEDIKTKDKVMLRIKVLTITRRRVNTSVKSAIRAKIREEVIKEVQKKTLEELITDINNNTTQKTISKNISSIYPIKSVEIRKIEILKKKKNGSKKEEKPQEKASKEENKP